MRSSPGPAVSGPLCHCTGRSLALICSGAGGTVSGPASAQNPGTEVTGASSTSVRPQEGMPERAEAPLQRPLPGPALGVGSLTCDRVHSKQEAAVVLRPLGWALAPRTTPLSLSPKCVG